MLLNEAVLLDVPTWDIGRSRPCRHHFDVVSFDTMQGHFAPDPRGIGEGHGGDWCCHALEFGSGPSRSQCVLESGGCQCDFSGDDGGRRFCGRYMDFVNTDSAPEISEQGYETQVSVHEFSRQEFVSKDSVHEIPRQPIVSNGSVRVISESVQAILGGTVTQIPCSYGGHALCVYCREYVHEDSVLAISEQDDMGKDSVHAISSRLCGNGTGAVVHVSCSYDGCICCEFAREYVNEDSVRAISDHDFPIQDPVREIPEQEFVSKDSVRETPRWQIGSNSSVRAMVESMRAVLDGTVAQIPISYGGHALYAYCREYVHKVSVPAIPEHDYMSKDSVQAISCRISGQGTGAVSHAPCFCAGCISCEHARAYANEDSVREISDSALPTQDSVREIPKREFVSKDPVHAIPSWQIGSNSSVRAISECMRAVWEGTISQLPFSYGSRVLYAYCKDFVHEDPWLAITEQDTVSKDSVRAISRRLCGDGTGAVLHVSSLRAGRVCCKYSRDYANEDSVREISDQHCLIRNSVREISEQEIVSKSPVHAIPEQRNGHDDPFLPRDLGAARIGACECGHALSGDASGVQYPARVLYRCGPEGLDYTRSKKWQKTTWGSDILRCPIGTGRVSPTDAICYVGMPAEENYFSDRQQALLADPDARQGCVGWDAENLQILPPGECQVQRQIWLAGEMHECSSNNGLMLLPVSCCPEDDGTDGDWFLRWVDYVEQLCHAACLSFGAMMMGAAFRLLLFGTGLKGGKRNVDPILRTARGVCRGASFAFLVTAWLMPLGAAMPIHEGGQSRASGISENLVDLELEAQMAAMADDRCRWVEHNAATADPPSFNHAPPEPGENGGGDTEGAFEAAVRVLLFQQIDHYTTCWVPPNATADSLCNHVAAEVLLKPLEFHVTEAKPQLADDVITVCVTPAWWAFTDRVGVVFDHLETGGQPFLGVLPTVCALGDVHTAFGKPVPEGMRFFLQNEITPLPRQGTFEVQAGFVFKLRTVGLQRIEVPTLIEAIRDPYWARDLATQGLPHPEAGADKLLVISPVCIGVFDVSSEPAIPQLHRMVCDDFDLDVDSNMMIFGRRAVVNTSYCGESIDRVAAIVPKAWLYNRPQAIGAFVDAREIGQGISFHVFGNRVVRTEEIVNLLEVTVPADLRVKIAGTEGPADEDGAMHALTQGSILTIWTAADNSSGTTSPMDTAVTEEEDDEEVAWRRPFYLGTSIFSFQKKTEFIKISIIPEDDVESVIQELNYTFQTEHPQCTLCQVQPQPCVPNIVVLVESDWTTAAGLVAVMIDAMPTGGKCFQAFCGPSFCRRDIIEVVGDDWRDVFQVYTEADGLIEEGSTYLTTRGMLVTLCMAEEDRPRYQSLEYRLQHPETWASTDPNELYSDEELRLHGTVLLGERSRMPIVDLPEASSWDNIRESVAAAIGTGIDDLRCATSAGHVQGLAIRGHRLPSLIGVVRVEQALPYGVFIDPRDLGMSIAYVQWATCTANITDILEAAGVRLIEGLPLHVQGALLFTPQSGTVTFRHRTLLTIKVNTDAMDGNGEHHNEDSDAGADDDGDPDSDGDDERPRRTGRRPVDSSPARSRSPRRDAEPELGSNANCHTSDVRNAAAQSDTLQLTEVGVLRLQKVIGILTHASCSRPGKFPLTGRTCIANVSVGDGPCGGASRANPAISCIESCSTVNVMPCPISLLDALPAATFNCDVQCLRLVDTETAQGWRGILQPWKGFRLSRCFDFGPLHDNTWAALALCDDDILGDSPRHLHFYTDGSEKEARTGWAVAITQMRTETGGVALLGYFGGAVIVDDTAGDFLGACQNGSREAEITAIGWTVLWLLGHWDLFRISGATIHFDCTSAGFAASGDWSDRLKSGIWCKSVNPGLVGLP